MRALVVADTHLTPATLDRMPDEVWAMADRADVVLHSGDVVSSDVLAALADRAPTHAVLGNNDEGRLDLPATIALDLAGHRVAMVHDSGPTAGRERRMARLFPEADVVVFGHSHAPVVARSGGQLLVNPGSPTHRRRQPVHTVAWLRLDRGAPPEAEIVEVGPLSRST